MDGTNCMVGGVTKCKTCGKVLGGGFSCEICDYSYTVPMEHPTGQIICPQCNGTGVETKKITCRHGQSSAHPYCEHDRLEPHKD